MKTCAIPGCGKRLLGRGWCSAHYNRWRRHGDPLGRHIGLAKKPAWLLAHATYTGEGCLLWPFSTKFGGYGQVWWEGHLTGAHRLMCTFAHGPAPSPDHHAAHAKGCPTNCVHPEHLRWATASENQLDRHANGTAPVGAANPQAKLTDADVLAIRANPDGLTQRRLAALYGVTQSQISRIVRGLQWRHP